MTENQQILTFKRLKHHFFLLFFIKKFAKTINRLPKQLAFNFLTVFINDICINVKLESMWTHMKLKLILFRSDSVHIFVPTVTSLCVWLNIIHAAELLKVGKQTLHWILTVWFERFSVFRWVLSVTWRSSSGGVQPWELQSFCSVEEQMGETRQGRMNSGQKEGDSRAWPPTCPPHTSPSVLLTHSLLFLFSQSIHFASSLSLL